MSDSDNLLDNLVSSLNKWSAHQASRQNSAEKIISHQIIGGQKQRQLAKWNLKLS